MNGNLLPEQPSTARWIKPALWLVQWILLFGLWIALSGEFTIEFLVLGALTAAAAIGFTHLLFRGTHEWRSQPPSSRVSWHLGASLRFALYIPWLVYEIFVSNLHVVYLVLHPRMPIDPTLVEFDSSLESERAQVLLAQSITLTPGTVTIDASDGKFLVHCLSAKSKEGLAEGSIQNKIAGIFSEPRTERVVLHDIERPGQVPL
jgi:multicomponent Na+:H+ antiporter subunit E